MSSDEAIREQCRAREEFEAYQRYLSKQIRDLKQQNAEQSALLAAKDSQLATQSAQLADKDSRISDLKAKVAELMAQLGNDKV